MSVLEALSGIALIVSGIMWYQGWAKRLPSQYSRLVVFVAAISLVALLYGHPWSTHPEWTTSDYNEAYCSLDQLSEGTWALRPVDGKTWPRLKEAVGYTCSDTKHALRCYLADESNTAELARLTASNSYRWEPTGCSMRPFDGEALVGYLARKAAKSGKAGGILFVGDSITLQHAQSFECMMGQHIESGFISDGTNSSVVLDHKGGRVNFVRSDYIAEPESNHVVLPDEVEAPGTPAAHRKWTHLLADKNFLVINTGAHWGDYRIKNLEKYRSMVTQTLEILDKYAPHVHLIYRSTVPGHTKCSRYNSPLLTDAPDLHGQYNWQGFTFFNKIWLELLEGHPRHIYMDVDFTSLRADGHRDPDRDCLHYCLPGPVDAWTIMLAHVIQSI